MRHDVLLKLVLRYTVWDSAHVGLLWLGVSAYHDALSPFSVSLIQFGISDAELGKIIAFIRSVPAVNNNLPDTTISVSGKILAGLGLLPPSGLAAAYIDHNAAILAPAAAVSSDYGKYLATVCTACHNPSFSGGPIPFGPPDQPPGANLTPAGDLAKWSDTDFVKFFHTGITPEGKHIDPKHMPWDKLGQMTDDELKALFLYLKSLPAKPTGSQ